MGYRHLNAMAVAWAALSGSAFATSFTFNPNMTITETPSLSELGDDDVDVFGESRRVTVLNGVSLDDITWTYQYTKGPYRVLSDDLADIDLLSLSGRGTSGARADVTLQFSDIEGNLIGTPYMFSNVSLAGPVPTIRDDGLSGALDGDDVLGNLKGLLIGDFRINVKMSSGRFELKDMTFHWEADDIEVAEPGTLLLLGAGFSSIGFAVRRNRRSSKRIGPGPNASEVS